MKTATVTINLTKEGHHVVREGVTPAELLLLVAEHHVNAGGDPVVSIANEKEVQRSDVDEKRRLQSIFAGNKIAAAYPGATPSLPTDFKTAKELGVKLSLPTSRLTETRIG